MAKVPAFARAFVGRWRIVEMDVWGNDFLDLVEEAHLTFTGEADGEIAFGALKGFLDVRYGSRDGAACAEFSWEGYDENDRACGRGWAAIGTAGRLVGHFTSTTATIQTSSANAADFFNSLLEAGRPLWRAWKVLIASSPACVAGAASSECWRTDLCRAPGSVRLRPEEPRSQTSRSQFSQTKAVGHGALPLMA